MIYDSFLQALEGYVIFEVANFVWYSPDEGDKAHYGNGVLAMFNS